MIRIALVALYIILNLTAYLGYSMGKTRVIEELTAASQANDAAAFSARIDWQPLREQLTEAITAQKKALGVQGGMMGPRLEDIARVVTHYVQPASIPVAFYYHDALFKGVKEEDFILETGYAAPYGFFVTLGYPKNAPLRHDMAAAMRNMMKVKCIFRLDGLTWKLSEMEVPLFMVPGQPHPLNIPGK